MSLVSKRNGWRVDEPLANTTDMTWVHLLMDKPYHDKLNWQRNRIRPSKFYILQDHLLPKKWTGRSDQKLLNFLYLAPPGELFFYYVTSERLSEGGGGERWKEVVDWINIDAELLAHTNSRSTYFHINFYSIKCPIQFVNICLLKKVIWCNRDIDFLVIFKFTESEGRGE